MKSFKFLLILIFLFFNFLPIANSADTTTVVFDSTAKNKINDSSVIQNAATRITILYTNNTNGSLEPCGCKGNKAGGLAQRMVILKKEREKDPDLLLVDAGDFFPTIAHVTHPKPVIEIMNLMKYDFVTLGDQEFINGEDYLKQQLSEMKFGIVSANLFQKDTGASFVPNAYVVKEVKGVKIGIIGITNGSIFELFPGEKIKNLKIKDPAESTRKIIQKLHKEVNILIVLSHSGSKGDRGYAEEVYWIDAIIGAHDAVVLDKPTFKGKDIPIFQAGRNGDHVGRLIFEYDTTSKKAKLMEADAIFVDKKDPKDPEVESIIRKFESSKLDFSDAMGRSRLLGANYCKKCHLNQFNSWTKSKHYQALMTLKKSKNLIHPNACFVCHVTNSESSDMYGVECESCHTIRRDHDSTRVKDTINESVCLNCHNKEKSPDFNFINYKEKIKH